MAKKTTFEILVKKSVFSQKWGSSLTLFWKFFLAQYVRLLNRQILWIISFFQTPLSFSANRKKLNFEKIKNDKSVFSDISWPLTSFIFFFSAAFWNRLIALMKLFSLGRTVLAGVPNFRWRLVDSKVQKTWLRLCCAWTVHWYGTLTAPWCRRFRALRPE